MLSSLILLLLLLTCLPTIIFSTSPPPPSSDDDNDINIQAEIRQLVHEGRLSTARWVALQYLLDQFYSTNSAAGSNELRKSLASAFVDSFDQAITTSSTASRGPHEYFDKLYQALQEQDNYNINSTMGSRRNLVKRDFPGCVPAISFGSDDPTKDWDDCCSMLPKERNNNIIVGKETNHHQAMLEMLEGDADNVPGDDGCAISKPCCDFSVGSSSHLRLPALHEPALAVRIISQGTRRRILDLEQDGYLRLFDVAGILWPSGYLLAQCVANPSICGIQGEMDRARSRHRKLSKRQGSSPLAVELGTGIGAPSIALAWYLQQYGAERHQVVATDVAPHALALTVSNAWHNDVSVAVDLLNYTNTTTVKEIREKYFLTPMGTSTRSPDKQSGFAVVMGSSLQSLFRDSHEPSSILWKTLGILMDRSNPHAIAILVHVRSDPVMPPSDGSFELIAQISGDRFDMQTRAGDSSDFEIFIFRRRSQEDEL